MAATMRAKVRLNHIHRHIDEQTGAVAQETLTFNPVARNNAYPDDGSDEDNTYAKFSPSGEFRLTIANPALIGRFAVGETYYVDFTPVHASAHGETATTERHADAGTIGESAA